MRKFLHFAVQFTWGLPQNLMGLIAFIILGAIRGKYAGRYKRAFISKTGKIHGLSLGLFIFVSQPYDHELIKHEYGHTLQSLFLGPLWLPVVGIPSLIWAGFFENYRKKHGIDYYSFYTERWANQLADKDARKTPAAASLKDAQ